MCLTIIHFVFRLEIMIVTRISTRFNKKIHKMFIIMLYVVVLLETQNENQCVVKLSYH